MSSRHPHPVHSDREKNGWSRRLLLKAGGLSLLSLGAGPTFLERLALATNATPGPDVLVSIFLRGAMDGLMAVQPLDDPGLAKLRPQLTLAADRSAEAPLLELDERFGLHPALAPLLPLYLEQKLAIVHGVGSPNPTRSHFEAQDYMEMGTPNRKSTPSGWLNRVADAAVGESSPFRAVSLTSDLPRSLSGSTPALAIEDLSRFQLLLPRNPYLAEKIGHDVESLYDKSARGLLRHRMGEMFDALRLFSQEDLAAYRREKSSLYPDSPLGRSLLQIAFLIKAGVGIEVACAESDGWDTHVGQGTIKGGFAERAKDLANSLQAFWQDLDLHQDRVTVLTMTEFGRTTHQNGSGGTDHGHGSCLFVLGHRARGGQIHGQVPELVPENLYEGRDLPVTTDFRAVFADVAGKIFHLEDDERIFPGWTGSRLPVLL